MSDINPIKLYEPALATGDEKALLHMHLRLAQQALLWKLERLTREMVAQRLRRYLHCP